MPTRISIAQDVVARDLAGEAMILDLETGTYFGLNEAGTRVWHMLEERATTEEIIAALLEEYDVEESRLRREVEDLVATLSAKGLVRIESEADTTPASCLEP